MNRAFALFGLLLALGLLVTACSSKSETVPAKPTTPATTPTGASDAPSPAAADAVADSIVVADDSEVTLGELV